MQKILTQDHHKADDMSASGMQQSAKRDRADGMEVPSMQRCPPYLSGLFMFREEALHVLACSHSLP